jgi:5-methylcytosine-specific restriction endonuclease McrA
MSDNFSNSKRFAIWSAYGGACQWCLQPLDWLDCQIDHVIPESLLKDPVELACVLEAYGLPSKYGVNDFENWVPVHPRCNRSKSDAVYRRVPLMLDYIRKANLKGAKSRKNFEQLQRNLNAGKLIGQVTAAIEAKTLTVDRMLDALKNLQAVLPTVPNFRLDFGGGWSIIGGTKDLVLVSDGNRAGIMPAAPNPDSSWICPTCGSHGPWNGVICLVCGRMSDPND